MTLNGAIMQLIEMRENSMMPEVFKPYFDKVIETVSECEEPSIISERKKGKWIYVNGHTAINCSACYHCGWSLSFEYTVKRFNFCPSCGADMRGE